jgi:DNA topoisomerase 2-associated protein PAT1
MRKHEKELIAKIQISQLVSDDPFKDDYYFQMRSLKKKKDQEEQEGGGLTFLGKGVGGGKLSGGGKMKKKGVKWQISAGQLVQGKTGAALSNQMQQQMKRLIESRRALKPREGNCMINVSSILIVCIVSLEGALGKIAVKSNRAPKQALEVAPPPPSSSANQLLSNTLLSLADLKCAENIFDAILTLEEFTRKKVPEKEDAKEKWFAFIFDRDFVD